MCSVNGQGRQHTSKIFGKADALHDVHRTDDREDSDRKGPRPGLRFGSCGGGEDDERCLVLRWRAPYGNSRASSSLKRQTKSRSRTCSTQSLFRSTPGIAGTVPIRALKVRHSPLRPLHRPETGSRGRDTGHEDWKFDVDMETQMLGSVKPYTRQASKRPVAPSVTQLIPALL